ncbi:MAG: hypothetical protein AAB590_03645, partial [Patescibacteria group bacterium]
MRKFIIIALLVTIYVLQVTPASAASPDCTGTLTTKGTFFQNFEQIEYSPSGLLILRFRVNPALMNGNRTIDSDDYLRNDECDAGT